MYEEGIRYPNGITLLLLAEALGVPPKWLAGLDDKKTDADVISDTGVKAGTNMNAGSDSEPEPGLDNKKENSGQQQAFAGKCMPVTAGTKALADGEFFITIPIPPCTKKNSQEIYYKYVKVAEGKSYIQKKVPFISPSEQYKRYEADCMPFLRNVGIDYPVNIRAHFFMDTLRMVDLTNLNEALHDVLQKYGVITGDDCRVVVGTDGSRVFLDRKYPRTEVLITREEATFPASSAKRKRKSQG